MESSSVGALVTMMTMAELSKLGCVARMAAVRLDVCGFHMAMRGCAGSEGCPVQGGLERGVGVRGGGVEEQPCREERISSSRVVAQGGWTRRRRMTMAHGDAPRVLRGTWRRTAHAAARHGESDVGMTCGI